jgi:hypothetical protein
LPTAKTLKAREVAVEPHAGHGGFTSSALDIDRTSWSKRLLHFPQVYS